MPAVGIADSQSFRYESDSQVSDYENDGGWLILPVAGPVGTKWKRLRVHSPGGRRVVHFSYSKRGSPPIFPTIGVDIKNKDGVITDRFLESQLVVTNCLGGDLNQRDYVVAGTNVYLQESVRGSGDKFSSGRQPYEMNSLNAAIIANNSFFSFLMAMDNKEEALRLALMSDPNGPNGWVEPQGLASASGSYVGGVCKINFADPTYKYFDPEISAAFQSESLESLIV